MERVITACSMPFFAKGDFTMGVFSEIAMEQQNSMFDSSAAFEDDEAFELEEMESLPVPPVGTDAVTVSAASVPAGETASADAEEEPVDEVASDGEEKRSLLRRGIRHNRPPQKMKKKSVRSMRRLKPSAKRNLTPNSRRRKPRSRSRSPVWKR